MGEAGRQREHEEVNMATCMCLTFLYLIGVIAIAEILEFSLHWTGNTVVFMGGEFKGAHLARVLSQEPNKFNPLGFRRALDVAGK